MACVHFRMSKLVSEPTERAAAHGSSLKQILSWNHMMREYQTGFHQNMIQANSCATRLSSLFVSLSGFSHSRTQCTGSSIQTACDHRRAGPESSLLSGFLRYGSYYLCTATQSRHLLDWDTKLDR